MELSEKEREQSESYLSAYEGLMGDERTRKTFNGIIYGIIGAESLRASQIARFSPWVGNGQVWGATGTAHGR
jgi:hypothetical protein